MHIVVGIKVSRKEDVTWITFYHVFLIFVCDFRIFHGHLSHTQEQMASMEQGRGLVKGGAFDGNTGDSPFTVDANMGINQGKYDSGWIVDRYRDEWDRVSQLGRSPVFPHLMLIDYCID